MEKTVLETLAERGETHGSFEQNADVSQRLKEVITMGAYVGNNKSPLTKVQKEALDLICTKISRACSNPSDLDHWKDIAGYAQLVITDMTEDKPF